MRDLSLALQQGFEKRKTKTIEPATQINLILLGLIILFGLSYLFIINSLSTKGYEIKKLEQRLINLESSQKKLQVEAADLQSINNLQLEAAKLNFVPATNITYLKDPDYAFK
jgi:hypothetical protein